jgi:hypothetical protein
LWVITAGAGFAVNEAVTLAAMIGDVELDVSEPA